jgi:hypothetical protein
MLSARTGCVGLESIWAEATGVRRQPDDCRMTSKICRSRAAELQVVIRRSAAPLSHNPNRVLPTLPIEISPHYRHRFPKATSLRYEGKLH